MQTELNIRRVNLLKEQLPELDINTEESVLESHGCDWTRFRKPEPSAVVFPRTNEEVIAIVRWAI